MSQDKALCVACDKGRSEEVKRLLADGADPNAEDQGWPALVGAALEGHEQCLTLLLGAGAEVDRPNENGVTPLYIAAQNGHEQCLKLLLGAGAAVDLANNKGATPLNMASDNGHIEVVKVLREHGASVTKCACFWPNLLSACCCCLPFCLLLEGRNICSTIPTLARVRVKPVASLVRVAPEQGTMDRAA